MKSQAISLIKVAFAAAALMGAATVAVGADAYETRGQDVLSVAKQKGEFNTLAKAIEAAGLQDVLKAQGPVTVFAPTDAAFAKLPAGTLENLLKPENREQLVKILTYHVVPGESLSQEQMKRTREVKTAQGSAVQFELVRGRLRVEEARVTADFKAGNGIVHAIDRVLIPN